MSQDLQAYLRDRAHVGEMGWGAGIAVVVGGYAALVALIVFMPRPRVKVEEPAKVTWVNLPAAMASQSGGAEAPVQGENPQQRLRSVEEVAPKPEDNSAKAQPAPPDATDFGLRNKAPKPPVKGENPDKTSTGKAPIAAKAAVANPNTRPGTAGSGGAGGLGDGSAIPGLNATHGQQGGVGLIGLDGGQDFPFVWYLQQVQATIVRNWNRLGGQGRVLIYFRIRKDGAVESARVDTSSGNGDLDQSALMAVRRSEPLPRLPDGYGADYLGIRFWFSYVGN